MRLPAAQLRKLVPMLSSDRDGEVVAAARAIGRTLKGAGCDWHDLATAIGGAAPQMQAPAPPRHRPARAKPSGPRPPSWSKLSRERRIAWLETIIGDIGIRLPERECRSVERILSLLRGGCDGGSAAIGPDNMKLIRRLLRRAVEAGVRPE